MKLKEKTFSTEDLVLLATGAAFEKKATRPVVLDLRSQGAFTEYFLVCSASNARQAAAIADGVKVFFKETFGLSPLGSDGYESLTWVLLDYGSFFVHVFQEPTRELYQLEQLWSKARYVEFTEQAVTKLLNDTRTLAGVSSSVSESE